MRYYIAKRLLLLLPVLFGISVLVFVLIRVMPGDAALMSLAREGGRITDEQLAALRSYWALDRPLYEQYVLWLRDALRFDFGNSWSTGRSVTSLILARITPTMNLALLSFVIALLIGVPLGIVSAYRKDTWIDYVARTVALVGLAIPGFWLGILIILALLLVFHWTPPVQYTSPLEDPLLNMQKMIWPAFSLGYILAAFIARMTRSTVLEILGQEYVRTARSKGLRETSVAIRHVLRNASLPVITVAGVYLAVLLGGVVVIEQVFTLQGLGTLLVIALETRDLPVIQAWLLLMGLFVALINLLTDVVYAWVDPRIKYG